jgi:hypothetical protein
MLRTNLPLARVAQEAGLSDQSPVGETTVDDDSRQAAYAVTGGRHRDVVIVHVANFDIVIGARQKLVKTSIFRR